MIPQGEAVVGAIGRRTRSRGREKAEVEELAPNWLQSSKFFYFFQKIFAPLSSFFAPIAPPERMCTFIPLKENFGPRECEYAFRFLSQSTSFRRAIIARFIRRNMQYIAPQGY
jgi:hypothetical protein